MFKNYIFDLYGTLIDIRTDENDSELWKKMAIFYGYRGAIYTPFEIMNKYNEFCAQEKRKVKEAYPDRKYVDINLTNVFEKLYTFKKVTPSPELPALTANTFRCCSTKHIRLYDGVKEFLEALNKKGKNVFLLSNAQKDFTSPEIDMLGLRKYFTDIIISSEVACKKPDPDMYRILFDRHNLSKSETIMIGNDCVADIKSSYDFGLQSLYIHQDISPLVTEKLRSTWSIMDGDFTKVMPLVLK
ncbi:MAG: HAD family hydrolase [Ruminococcaceae bacterium]|nr:HAD family hydrolase [Oscillospiraceae bacterium]